MRFYRALLRLFPRSFRAEYGAEMTKASRASGRRARRSRCCALVVATRSPTSSRTPCACISTSCGRTCVTPFARCGARRVHVHRDPRRRARHRRHHRHVLARRSRPAAAAAVRRPDGWSSSGEDHTSRGYPRMEPSPPNYRDWKRMATSFEHLRPSTAIQRTSSAAASRSAWTAPSVTRRRVRAARRQAALGRMLTRVRRRAETQRPVVISDRLWRTRFAADPDVLGRRSLDDATATSSSASCRRTSFSRRATPISGAAALRRRAAATTTAATTTCEVMARLKPGVTLEQARAEMRTDRRPDRAAVSRRSTTGKGVTSRRGATRSRGSRACCCRRWSARRSACC